jgi:hypothetical protein
LPFFWRPLDYIRSRWLHWPQCCGRKKAIICTVFRPAI